MLKLNIIFTRSDLIKESAAGNLLNYPESVKSTINNIENNRYEPTLLTICMLAEALQVAPEDLYSYNVTP